MEQQTDGYFSVLIPEAAPGMLYKFRVESRECPDKNAGELAFGCIFAMRRRAAKKLLYPERGTSQYLLRVSLRSNDVCYLVR